MRLLYNRFLITCDADAKATLPIKGHNGEYLTLDRRYDPFAHAQQVGVIQESPMEFVGRNIDSQNLKKGDTVWFHHHVAQPKNLWLLDGKEYYQCHWEQIWAKVENEALIPVNDWLFVEPILEDEKDRVTSFGFVFRDEDEAENLKGIGRAFAVSPHCKEMGIQEGDLIHFLKNADYNIKIGDKDLWRMKLVVVIAIERDGKLLPIADRMIIEEDPHESEVKRNGVILPWDERTKNLYGNVLEAGKHVGIAPGTRVCFFQDRNTQMRCNDKELAIVRKENIVYVE